MEGSISSVKLYLLEHGTSYSRQQHLHRVFHLTIPGFKYDNNASVCDRRGSSPKWETTITKIQLLCHAKDVYTLSFLNTSVSRVVLVFSDI